MSDNYFALKAQKDRIVAAQDARVVALELGLRSFLHLFAHTRGEVYSRDWTPSDWKSWSDVHGAERRHETGER